MCWRAYAGQVGGGGSTPDGEQLACIVGCIGTLVQDSPHNQQHRTQQHAVHHDALPPVHAVEHEGVVVVGVDHVQLPAPDNTQAIFDLPPTFNKTIRCPEISHAGFKTSVLCVTAMKWFQDGCAPSLVPKSSLFDATEQAYWLVVEEVHDLAV